MMILVLELFTSCLNTLIEAKLTVLRDLSLILYMSKSSPCDTDLQKRS